MTLRKFSLPLASPLETAHGTIRHREGYLLQTNVGEMTGLGEATPLAGWTESNAACRDRLEAAVETAESGDYERAVRDLEVAQAPAASHGFTTALYDAMARRENTSLADWLADGRCADTVPVHATIGADDPNSTVEAVQSAAMAGFDTVKLKVGTASVDADIERVRAVREAFSGLAIRLDANGAWTRQQAATVIETLAPLDIAYLEQPVPGDELQALADLAGGSVPIAVDESLIDHPLHELLSGPIADMVVLKPMVLGGPGETVTLARRARDAGVTPVISTTIDGVVARLAALHAAAALADPPTCGLATAALLQDDLAPDPAPVKDGRIAVPHGPGLGLDPDEVTL
jgi:o-succinylbenzoate synthase